MSTLGERLRRAAAGVGRALGDRRPGTELARVDQVDQSEPAAPPTPPPLPLALPAPPHPVCPRCKQRHEPRPIPGRDGTGLAALYGQQVVADPGRPQPLGRGADETPLVLRHWRPWSGV
jgi:hypothetical protein